MKLTDMPVFIVTDSKATPSEKYPLGVKPRNVWVSERISDLLGAMGRYASTGKNIPQEWIDHLTELNNMLRKGG